VTTDLDTMFLSPETKFKVGEMYYYLHAWETFSVPCGKTIQDLEQILKSQFIFSGPCHVTLGRDPFLLLRIEKLQTQTGWIYLKIWTKDRIGWIRAAEDTLGVSLFAMEPA
jgi:hypothetical protein